MDDEESVEDAWDGRGRRATFARLFSDEVPLQPQVEEEDDQSFGGPIGGFDDDYDDQCDADVVQEACQQHLDELAGAVASYAQLARIADRVAQWQERLAPILAAQEAGPPFDILASGEMWWRPSPPRGRRTAACRASSPLLYHLRSSLEAGSGRRLPRRPNWRTTGTCSPATRMADVCAIRRSRCIADGVNAHATSGCSRHARRPSPPPDAGTPSYS